MKNLFLFLLLFTCVVASAQRWSLADFSITANNQNLALGLCGGLNAPQIYPLDLNLDGVDDLLVFDRDGNKTLVFEGVEKNGCIIYELNDWLASFFPYMREFVIPRDYSGDGVPDLFTYSLTGAAGMQVHLGSAHGDHLEFELVVLDQNYQNVLAIEIGGNLSNLAVSRIDLPGIADLDLDGDLDILSFPSNGGSLQFFRNLQVERNLAYDAILFELASDCWGGFYESDFSQEIFLSGMSGGCAQPVNGADTRHNGSSTLIFDPNKDGLPDVVIGDFTSDNLVLLENGGTLQNAWMTEQDFLFPSYGTSVDMSTFLAAYQLDVNCDGKKDLLIAPNITNGSMKTDNILYYENIGRDQDSFNFKNNTFLIEDIFDYGVKSAPTLVDLNADGWLDIVVGVGVDFSNPNPLSTGLISLISNGDANDLSFVITNTNYLNFSAFAEDSRAFAPTFADMDSDGDMDLIVGDEEGFLFYGNNVAGPGQPVNIPNVNYGWKGIDAGQFAVPTVVDMNGDGLLDLIVGEKNPNNDVDGSGPCGNINYYQNKGSAQSPDFNPNSNTLPNLNCLGRINTKYPNNLNGMAAPTFYATPDSLLMFVGVNAGTIARHRVTSLGEIFPAIDTLVGKLDEGYISRPAVGDLNKDGILDVVVGNQRGGISIYTTDLRTDGSIISANNNIDEKSIRIYPNPVGAGEELILEGIQGVTSFQLCNLNGQLVMDQLNLEHQTLVVVPEVTAGIYIAHIQNKQQSISIKIIITD